jgi:hypothetical protein
VVVFLIIMYVFNFLRYYFNSIMIFFYILYNLNLLKKYLFLVSISNECNFVRYFFLYFIQLILYVYLFLLSFN